MSDQHKKRTYAHNRLISRKGNENIYESDGVFLLKLIIVVLLGVFWLRFSNPFAFGALHITALPLGFLIGLLLVSRLEKYQFNRKIWYTVLLLITVISYFVSAGIVL